jgi:hypothetical protein
MKAIMTSVFGNAPLTSLMQQQSGESLVTSLAMPSSSPPPQEEEEEEKEGSGVAKNKNDKQDDDDNEDVVKLFCAVATDISTMQFRPYVFRSFAPGGGGHSSNNANIAASSSSSSLHDGLSYSCTVVEALMSSTAAPTYFSTSNVTVDGEQRTLTDG